MFRQEKPPMVAYDPPTIRFILGGKQIAEASLAQLRRVIVVTCFDPQVAPDPFPEIFDLLDFGDTFWLVTDSSAEPFIAKEWVEHLQTLNGYFTASGGALPSAWKRRYLLLFKHGYYPKPVVVPAQPTPFLEIAGPFDPARIGEDLRQEYEAIMNHYKEPSSKG